MIRPRPHHAWLVIALPFLVAVQPSMAQQVKKQPWAVVQSWDRNRDGLLQQAEIPKAARSKIQSLAKMQGMDPGKPIPIKQLIAGAQSKPSKKPTRAPGAIKANEPAQSVADAEEKEAKKRNGSEAKNSKAVDGPIGTRSKRAFGRKSASAAFGKKEAKPALEQIAESEKAVGPQRNAQMARLTKSMMFQHDRNKNGQLEKSEWQRIRGNPGLSDHDKNGVLTSQELSDHLAGFASRERQPRTTAERTSTKKSRDRASDSKKSYRFLTPHERLPAELPEWFVDRDLNGDGQLTLKEYAQRLTRSIAAKFAQLDLNHDGMLIAREYLKATE